MTTPVTVAEWTAAAAMAEACLALDSARLYGLVTGGPVVNVNRCVALLAEAKARGVVPTPAQVDAATQALIADGSQSASMI